MLERFNIKAGVYFAEWTVAELAKAHTYPTRAKNFNPVTYASVAQDPSFYGCESVTDAARPLTQGWTEGAAQISALAQTIGDVVGAKSRARRVRFSDVGDEIEIGRALAGQWEHAFRTTRREWVAGSAVVEIFTRMGGSCFRSQDELFYRGAAGAVLCDVLENAGYRVRLVATHCAKVQRSGEVCRFDYVLKEAADPLSLDLVAAVACKGSTARALSMRARETAPFRNLSGHGSSEAPEIPADLAAAGEGFPEGAIVIGTDCFDEGSCIAEIRRGLEIVQTGVDHGK